MYPRLDQRIRQRAPLINALAGMLLMTAAASAATNDFAFSSPSEGAIYKVGDVMRIEFDSTDSNGILGRDMIGFSRSNGASRTFAFLPLFLNGTDTVSLLKHFDWVIPDTFTSSRDSKLNVNTVSDSCRVCIAHYETKTTRGISSMFTIRPSGVSAVSRLSIVSPRQSAACRWVAMTNGEHVSAFAGPSVPFAVDGRLHRVHDVNAGAPRGRGMSAGVIVGGIFGWADDSEARAIPR